MSALVHVSREGAPLGQFRRDQIASLMDNGTLRPDDLYFDEQGRQWTPLDRIKLPTPFVPQPDPPTPPPDTDGSAPSGEESHSRRRRRRSGTDSGPRKPRRRHPAEGALPGWIVALFAIGAAAALWAWAQSLRDELRSSVAKVRELEETVSTLQRHNNLLLEMSPPNTIRGAMTAEPSKGRLAILSGIRVAAYRLDDVRSAVFRVANLPTPVTEEEFASMITTLQDGLPPPKAETLTDSNGRFEISLPDSGDYALVAVGFRPGGASNERLFWLSEVASVDEPSPVVSLSDRNAISLRAPTFKTTPARR